MWGVLATAVCGGEIVNDYFTVDPSPDTPTLPPHPILPAPTPPHSHPAPDIIKRYLAMAALATLHKYVSRVQNCTLIRLRIKVRA